MELLEALELLIPTYLNQFFLGDKSSNAILSAASSSSTRFADEALRELSLSISAMVHKRESQASSRRPGIRDFVFVVRRDSDEEHKTRERERETPCPQNKQKR
jgi:hypothetical protein